MSPQRADAHVRSRDGPERGAPDRAPDRRAEASGAVEAVANVGVWFPYTLVHRSGDWDGQGRRREERDGERDGGWGRPEHRRDGYRYWNADRDGNRKR